MKREPLVSILINNYNYGRFLAEAIDSAIMQDYPRTEVVVVDDGSSDESVDVIRRYGDRVIPVLKPNGGQASAFNAGFAACRGKIICLEDADDYFVPQKVTRVVEAFTRNPAAGWCYHSVRWVDVNGKPIKREMPQRYRTGMLDLRRDILSGRVSFVAPPTSGLAFRASLLRQILPMPESIDITSDNYIKFASFGLAPGMYLEDEIACQRIHDNNAFTRKSGTDKERTHARIKLLTAHALQREFPDFHRFSDGLFASSLVSYWTNGGIDRSQSSLVRNYLHRAGIASKCRITAKTIFYLGRIGFRYSSTHGKHRDISPHSPASIGNLHR
jgi:hypothetical protein